MLTRLLRAAAAGFVAAADSLETKPPKAESVQVSLAAQYDPDDPEALSLQLCAEHELRDALHRALRKYSPTEPPAQA